MNVSNYHVADCFVNLGLLRFNVLVSSSVARIKILDNRNV